LIHSQMPPWKFTTYIISANSCRQRLSPLDSICGTQIPPQQHKLPNCIAISSKGPSTTSATTSFAEIFRPPRDRAHSSLPASCHLGAVNNPSLSLSHSCLYYLAWCILCLLPNVKNLRNLTPPPFLSLFFIFPSSSSVSVCIQRAKTIPSTHCRSTP